MIVDLEKKWLPRAKCREFGNDLFFTDHGVDLFRHRGKPSKQVVAKWERAKDICYDCPVMLQCARDFLGEVEGVWGGWDPLERRAERLKHSERVADLPPGPERREYARLAYFLRKHPRYRKGDTERIMGLREGTINTLVKDHEAVLAAQKAAEERRRAKAAEATVTEIKRPKIRWPGKSPEGADGWVHHHGNVVRAYYLGETEDGQWMFMKAPLSDREDSMSWFRKRDVRLTRTVVRTVRRRVGETSRIYGTVISPHRGAATKAG